MATLEELTQMVEALAGQVKDQKNHIQELEAQVTHLRSLANSKNLVGAEEPKTIGRRRLLKNLAAVMVGGFAATAVTVATNPAEAQARMLIGVNPGAVVVRSSATITNNPLGSAKKYGLVASADDSLDLSTLSKYSAGVYGRASRPNINDFNGFGAGVIGEGKGYGDGIFGSTEKGYSLVLEAGLGKPLRIVPNISQVGIPPAFNNIHQAGDFYVDSRGYLYYCYAPGNPGSWKQLAP